MHPEDPHSTQGHDPQGGHQGVPRDAAGAHVQHLAARYGVSAEDTPARVWQERWTMQVNSTPRERPVYNVTV
jgi:hypothetical protein